MTAERAPRRLVASRPVRRRFLLIAAGTAGAAALAVAAADLRGREPAQPAAAPKRTVPVVRRNLADVRTLKGQLNFGPPTTVNSQISGVVTGLASSGAVVGRGALLYSVDNRPVVLFYGPLPMWRDLEYGAKGADVQQLETNLFALGHLTGSVDSSYTSRTYDAVRRWQRQVGLAETGRVELGRIVYAPAAVRVASHRTQPGLPAAGAMMDVTGTDKAVTLRLSAADRDLARTGSTVSVVLPSDTTTGTVSAATTVTAAAAAADAGETILVTIALADQDKAKPYDERTVDVRFTIAERQNVLTVPVIALLALREGGYGVEVADNGGSRILAIKVGLFAEGTAEVSGSGLAEGMAVVVPA